MALTWKVTDETFEKYPNVCINPEEPEDKQLFQYNPKTESVVWNMMIIGMNSITKDNVAECIARYRILNAACGVGDWYLTAQEWVDHVGLTTNVSNETRASFDKRMHEMAVKTAREEVSKNAEG